MACGAISPNFIAESCRRDFCRISKPRLVKPGIYTQSSAEIFRRLVAPKYLVITILGTETIMAFAVFPFTMGYKAAKEYDAPKERARAEMKSLGAVANLSTGTKVLK